MVQAARSKHNRPSKSEIDQRQRSDVEIPHDLYASTQAISVRSLRSTRSLNYPVIVKTVRAQLQRAWEYSVNYGPGTASATLCGIVLACLPHYGTAAISTLATGFFVLAIGILYDLYNWREFLHQKIR